MKHKKNTTIFCKILLAVVLVFCCGHLAEAQCNVQQISKLLADDGDDGDNFGRVAISGSIAIVGAQGDDDNGEGSGSAYIFNTKTGQQVAKLIPNDGGATNDHFGGCVAISGTTAIVGAHGSAYLFDITTGQQLHKLRPNDGAAGFGEPGAWGGGTVGIDGTTAVVGAQDDDVNGFRSGSAYVFDTITGQQIHKLLPNDGNETDRFGETVAVNGTTAFVAAVHDDHNGPSSGSIYLFDTTSGQQIAKVLPNDGDTHDFFGVSISVHGNIILVGAMGDDDNGSKSGSAYLFDTTTGQQIAKLLADDGAQDDRFGRTVAISGNIALVGASQDNNKNGGDAGSVYLFDIAIGRQIVKILADDGAGGDRFGTVAISGATAIVGAHRDDDNGTDSGAAYLFDVSDVKCDVVVNANSFLVTRGTYVSGGVAELTESDNMDLSLRRSNSDLQSRTEFEAEGVSPVASPSSMEVTLESSVFARSQVDQTIELFDYVVGDWEQIDTRAATRFTDSTVTVAATGDLSRFVEAGTMCIQARIRYQSPVARQRFSSNTDQFVWMIGQ